jgi:hypothetical protein
MSKNLPEKKLSELLENQPSSAEDFPASHTALQENVKHLVMTVISGRSCGESFAKLDRDGSWVKTSQDSVQVRLDNSLEMLSETWPRWGIVSGGVAGKLRMSEPVTTENGCSLLPTVTTQEVEHPEMIVSDTGRRVKETWKDSHPIGLADRIAMLPTPRTTDSTGGLRPNDGKNRIGANGEKWGINLSDKIAMLPTPRSREAGNYQYAAGNHEKPTLTLSGVVAMLPTPTSRDHKDTGTMENVPVNALLGRELGKNHGMKLQPAFAEWMMGFPEGWTDLDA